MKEYFPVTTAAPQINDGVVKIGDQNLVVFDAEQYKSGVLDLVLFQPGNVGHTPMINKLIEAGTIKDKAGAAGLIGKFVFPSLGLVMDDLTAVPIAELGRPRSYYMAEYKSGDAGSPDCASFNGMTPNPSIISPMSPACATVDATGRINVVCDQAKWGANKEKPACRQNIVISMLELQYGIPFRWVLKGTAISVWNKFIRQYTDRVKASEAAAKLRAVLGDRINLGSKKGVSVDEVMKFTSENQGTFCSVKLETATLEGFDINAYAPLLKHYSQEVFAWKPNGQAAIEGPADASKYIEGPPPEEAAVSVDAPAMPPPAEVDAAEGFNLS